MKQKVEVHVKEADISNSVERSLLNLTKTYNLKSRDITKQSKSLMIKFSTIGITKEGLVFDEGIDNIFFKKLLGNLLREGKKLKIYNSERNEVWAIKPIKSGDTGTYKYLLMIDTNYKFDRTYRFMLEIQNILDNECIGLPIGTDRIIDMTSSNSTKSYKISEQLGHIVYQIRDRLTTDELNSLQDIQKKLQELGV